MVQTCTEQSRLGKFFVIQVQVGSPVLRVPSVRTLFPLKNTRIVTLKPGKTVSEDNDAVEPLDPKGKGVTLVTNLPELAHISEKLAMGVNLSGLIVSKDPGDQVWLRDWVVASVRKSRGLTEEAAKLVVNELAYECALQVGLKCQGACPAVAEPEGG